MDLDQLLVDGDISDTGLDGLLQFQPARDPKELLDACYDIDFVIKKENKKAAL